MKLNLRKLIDKKMILLYLNYNFSVAPFTFFSLSPSQFPSDQPSFWHCNLISIDSFLYFFSFTENIFSHVSYPDYGFPSLFSCQFLHSSSYIHIHSLSTCHQKMNRPLETTIKYNKLI